MNPNARESAVRTSLDAVLRLAWAAGAFTASDAISAIGLTRSTSIAAIEELMARGLVVELPDARAAGEYRNGRPARRFELRDTAAVVVGMDVGRSHLTTIVADLRGRRLAADTVDADPEWAPEVRRATVLGAYDAALVAAGFTADDVLAACIGVAAPVDRHGRSPDHPDGFWHRTNPELGAALQGRARIVTVENDASLAAVAEGVAGAALGSRDYVALLAGARFGAGVVVDGRLLRGAHGGAGEMVALDHVVGVGRADGMGARIVAWARAEVESGRIPRGHPLAQLSQDSISAQRVLALAHAGDDPSRAIIDQAAAMLARIVGVFGSLYDPELVVVSGAISAGIGDVVGRARELLPAELDLPAPRLIASELGAEVVALGAVAAAVESARDGVLSVGLPGGSG